MTGAVRLLHLQRAALELGAAEGGARGTEARP